eukprot:CAMPEP_0119319906 /NCGR_PEP_ID=MMETSP1333-20130426/50764_1 /TAXON_ID=418940 /ORGANISM="Scyphosphaera apsteinii, Strain RCC1455" /LENGTH=35 /DNA_ID= /DNA_START= /DNA_END= /DNA_ORIENTATION=
MSVAVDELRLKVAEDSFLRHHTRDRLREEEDILSL